jgi:TolA-binding protein
MSVWRRSFALLVCLGCAVSMAGAQELTEQQRAQQETEAKALFEQGEARMKIAEYEPAIGIYRNVLKRYPSTETRYQAQFRMADAYVAMKKEADAVSTLQTVVKEENPDWSPKALLKIGELYAGMQKYTESFRAYRQIIVDYPDSPMVDRAYFSIGVTHFKLGHYEQAAVELDKVGTAYASRVPELQRVSPGEPLNIRLVEPNMVASPELKLPVTIISSSGDLETIDLIPDAEGSDHFSNTIPTKLGVVAKNSKVLELHGNDTVTLKYKSRYVGGDAVERTVPMTIASNGRLAVRDSKGNEVRGVVVSDAVTIEVYDPDRDLADGKDTIQVELKTKKKDLETFKLTETDGHSGVFTAVIPTLRGEPTPNSGKIETNADLKEGSATEYNDTITVTYQDDQHLSVSEQGPRKVMLSVSQHSATNAALGAVDNKVNKADLEIQKLLLNGKVLTEIAGTYRDLGQDGKATVTFRRAAEQFNDLLKKYPNAAEAEDAMFGLFQNYVAQGLYESAITVITQITRKFPQSTRASEALFHLAQLHVKMEEYDRALAIYQNIAARARGTSLAEEAQFAICTTYMEMFKPKANKMDGPGVTREQITAALEEFSRNYPNSERTPEALFELVRFRFEGEDYRGAVDTGRRMVALYPDHVMAGRALLLVGQAYYKLRNLTEAEATFRTIIANYGAESDQARKLWDDLQKKFGRGKTSAATDGGADTGAGAGAATGTGTKKK